MEVEVGDEQKACRWADVHRRREKPDLGICDGDVDARFIFEDVAIRHAVRDRDEPIAAAGRNFDAVRAFDLVREDPDRDAFHELATRRPEFDEVHGIVRFGRDIGVVVGRHGVARIGRGLEEKEG